MKFRLREQFQLDPNENKIIEGTPNDLTYLILSRYCGVRRIVELVLKIIRFTIDQKIIITTTGLKTHRGYYFLMFYDLKYLGNCGN